MPVYVIVSLRHHYRDVVRGEGLRPFPLRPSRDAVRSDDGGRDELVARRLAILVAGYTQGGVDHHDEINLVGLMVG